MKFGGDFVQKALLKDADIILRAPSWPVHSGADNWIVKQSGVNEVTLQLTGVIYMPQPSTLVKRYAVQLQA